MRFFANGPAIPDELIEARSRGKVVFFCGAGVSVDSGMPSFLTLTNQVCRDVFVHSESPIGRAIYGDPTAKVQSPTKPLDQIFGMLQKEYAKEKIERLVAKRLRLKPNSRIDHHKTVVTLSSDLEGNPLVVTTNFEQLFERAAPKSKIWLPPNLPDLVREVFANNLRALRAERGLSQEELAHQADLDRTYISSLERCVYSPSIDVIDKLARVLGVAAADLLRETP